jgi:hypothetical protein
MLAMGLILSMKLLLSRVMYKELRRGLREIGDCMGCDELIGLEKANRCEGAQGVIVLRSVGGDFVIVETINKG